MNFMRDIGNAALGALAALFRTAGLFACRAQCVERGTHSRFDFLQRALGLRKLVAGFGNPAALPTFRSEAFRWTAEEGMVGLGDLPGGDFASSARSASLGGAVIVGHSTISAVGTQGSTDAFIWTSSGGMRSLRDLLVTDYGLDLTGWTLGGASDVSSDGTVTRYAANLEPIGVARIPTCP